MTVAGIARPFSSNSWVIPAFLPSMNFAIFLIPPGYWFAVTANMTAAA